jgi:outer membrane protein TolC
MTVTRSAELARLLRLDGRVELVPAEERIVPVKIVDDSTALDELLATGLSNRPELRQYQHLVAATNERIRQEHWRPWLPNLAVGYSAGTFGGGPSGQFDNQSGRGDFDALAAWELNRLGLGNYVLRRQRASQNRQAYLQFAMVRDRVIAEVTTAAADLHSYLRQIDATTGSIQAANESYQLNFQRIRQGEGLPIELLQAIRARTDAQDAYTQAVTNYNRSQFRLLRALGQPPSMTAR